MNQEERELQQDLDNYKKAMEEKMQTAEEKRKELIQRILSTKTYEVFNNIYDTQHEILTNFIALFLKNNPYETLDEQTKNEFALLEGSKWIMLNDQNTLIVSDGQNHHEFAFNKLSKSTQYVIQYYQNAIKKNSKLKELYNLLSKIKGKEFNDEIEQKIDFIEENFRNISKNTDIQLVNDIIYHIDTFKEVTNETGEKSYVGKINGEEREFKELDDMELAMAIGSSLLTYQVFMNSMPKVDSKISLSTEYLNTDSPIKDNGSKRLKARQDDVQNMYDDLSRQDEIDRQMENDVKTAKEQELSKEQVEAIRSVFSDQPVDVQEELKRYANKKVKKSNPRSLSDKVDETLEGVYDSVDSRLEKACKGIYERMKKVKKVTYYHTPLRELRRFKNRVLDKVGFGKQQIEGANLSVITGKKEDENKPLFVFKKMAKEIRQLGASKLAVTQDGLKGLETIIENAQKALESQGVEVQDSKKLAEEKEQETIIPPQVEEHAQDDKRRELENATAETSQETLESQDSKVQDSKKLAEEKEPETIIPPRVEETVQYDKLKEFALKTIASQQLSGKDLENALNSVDLTKEDLHLYMANQQKSEREKWKYSMKSDVIRYINSLDDKDKAKKIMKEYEEKTGTKIRDIELQENVALPENELEVRTYEKEYQENLKQKQEEQRRQNAIDREIMLSNLASRYPSIVANPLILDKINEQNKGKFEIAPEDVVSYLDPVTEQDYDTKRDDFIKLVSSASEADKLRLLGGTEGFESNRYGVTLNDVNAYQNGLQGQILEGSMGKSK